MDALVDIDYKISPDAAMFGTWGMPGAFIRAIRSASILTEPCGNAAEPPLLYAARILGAVIELCLQRSIIILFAILILCKGQKASIR
jgi:hypothetical protein